LNYSAKNADNVLHSSDRNNPAALKSTLFYQSQSEPTAEPCPPFRSFAFQM